MLPQDGALYKVSEGHFATPPTLQTSRLQEVAPERGLLPAALGAPVGEPFRLLPQLLKLLGGEGVERG
jgi:hypothetical protein